MAGLEHDAIDGGRVRVLTLAAPPANLVDIATTRRITELVEDAGADSRVCALLFRAEGEHFSYGASVSEHLPERCAEMLQAFHEMFRRLLAVGIPAVAAVRGRCLGGGLELVAFCQRVFAAPDARLGQPEIRLGLFAPVGSILLTERLGRGAAEEMCLGGAEVDAARARELGLVDDVGLEPEAAALAWVRATLLDKSPAALRLAVRAARVGLAERFGSELARIERLYLEELMATRDAHEGLAAFLERRPPQWQGR